MRRAGPAFPRRGGPVVTRGFESTLVSSYSQYVRQGGEKRFDGFLAEELDELVRLFAYDDVIARFRQRFGDDRVWILPYELLQADPAAFTEEVAARMVLEEPAPPIARVNVALTPAALDWFPLVSRQVTRVAAVLGSRRGQRLFVTYRRALDYERHRTTYLND